MVRMLLAMGTGAALLHSCLCADARSHGLWSRVALHSKEPLDFLLLLALVISDDWWTAFGLSSERDSEAYQQPVLVRPQWGQWRKATLTREWARGKMVLLGGT